MTPSGAATAAAMAAAVREDGSRTGVFCGALGEVSLDECGIGISIGAVVVPLIMARLH